MTNRSYLSESQHGACLHGIRLVAGIYYLACSDGKGTGFLFLPLVWYEHHLLVAPKQFYSTTYCN